MSDFIPRLRQEVVEATARDERRGPAVRALVVLAPPRGVRAPLSAAIAGVAAVLAVAALLTLGRPAPRHAAVPAKPRVVARLTLADSSGTEAGGFGAMWVQDTTLGRLLRVDARSHRVVARIPVAGAPEIATGAGAVWLLTGGTGYTLPGPLVAVDPHTNRISARIPLVTPQGKPFTGGGVVVIDGAVWVFGPDGAIRLDPRTHRFVASLKIQTSRGFGSWAVSDGRAGWLITEDGRLVRFDARTGARLASAHTDLDQPTIDAADAGGIFVNGSHGLARLDPATGRQVWRTTIRGDLYSVVMARGRLWATMSGAYGGNVIRSYDPATGRLLTTTALPDFVGSTLAATGSDVWALGDNGKVDVVKP